MATYFVSDFNTGTPPSGWTKRWNTTPTWTGANPLAIPVGVLNDWVGLTLDSVDSDSTRADVELLVKWTTQGTLATARIFVVRGSGADESATHYHYSYLTTTHSVGYCAGSDTRTNITTAAFTFAASTTYWTRCRVNGSTLRVRTWADGGSEPGTWDIDTTDSNVTAAGWVGFSTNATGAGPTILQIGVGTNGDTAPSSAGSGASADLAATGNSGTFSGTANSPATATLAQTGGSGTLSASAGAGASAALAATGDSGTLAASAYTPALASLAATGASGIFVGSAFSEATAALSATGGSGALSASAGTEASASLDATGGSGALAAEAFVQAVATLAATGVSGALIASAWTTISASLAATGGGGELTATAGEPVVATRVLSSYRPLLPPTDPKDFGQWAMNELLTIARHLADGRDFDLLNTIHAPPSKPREGMVVHADGTNWDPGSGAGRYERVGGAWVKL